MDQFVPPVKDMMFALDQFIGLDRLSDIKGFDEIDKEFLEDLGNPYSDVLLDKKGQQKVEVINKKSFYSLGADGFGDELLKNLSAEGVNNQFVVRDTEMGTGVAMITVDKNGNNTIVAVPKANMSLNPDNIDQAESEIAAADILLLQLEVNLLAVQRAAEIAKANDVPVLLNPAPAHQIPVELMNLVDIIVPNETETEFLSKDDEAIIILNQTPFYGESGGQIGDSGKIICEDSIFEVYDTTKLFGSFFLHHGKVKNGQFSKKESVTAIIDTNKRQLTKCNHSSTHLLHSSLRKVLGNHVSQKGSLVNNEKLRFDFSHNEPISSDNIIKIENYVKMEITKNSPVNTKIIDHQKAIEEGAMALFGEKYGDEVRVVSMGSKEGEKIFSKELCGGTHVNRTGDIIDFKIINQSSVASGIRRLEALTNISVKQFENEQIRLNKQKEDDNKIKIDQLIKEIQKIDGNFTYSNKNNDSLPNQIKELRKNLDNKKQNLNKENTSQNIISEKINDIMFVYLVADDYPPKLLKQFVDDQKNKYKQKCVSLIISSNNNKLSIVIGSTNDIVNNFDSSKIIQEVSLLLGGKGGGGRKDLAQAGGTDLTNLEDAINKIRDNLNF